MKGFSRRALERTLQRLHYFSRYAHYIVHFCLQVAHTKSYVCALGHILTTTNATTSTKALAGTYVQTYSNGHKDSTTVACDGTMTWSGNKLKGKMYPAGSKLPASRAAQNNDPNYQAKDGWYFRPWDRASAWEFVKFENGNNMIVHHFCAESGCTKKSSRGSGKYCCGSTSKRVPIYCGGAFKCCDNN